MALHDRPHGRRLRHATGSSPYYGPFGDIADVVACEDQFRNAYLLGCVGAWSLHPAQVDIAKRVFSPDPTDVAHAKEVIDAMGDGTGAVMLDGKMEDDASVKQCQVIVALAEQPGRPRPRARRRLRRTGARERRAIRPRRSVLYMPGANERALEKAKAIAADAIIFDLEDAVAPDAKAEARGAGLRRRHLRRVRQPRSSTIRVNGLDTEWHADDLRPPAAAGPAAVVVPKVRRWPTWPPSRRASSAAGAPDHTTIWAMVETPVAMLHAEEIAAASERLAVLVMGTNDLAKELHAEHVPGRGRSSPASACRLLAARATGKVILDGVYNDIKDEAGVRGRVRPGPPARLRRQDAHPPEPGSSRPTGVWAPADDAVEPTARELIATFEDGDGRGQAASSPFNGRMIENMHVDNARRLIALSDAIRSLA